MVSAADKKKGISLVSRLRICPNLMDIIYDVGPLTNDGEIALIPMRI